MSPRIPKGRVAPRVLMAAAALLTVMTTSIGAQRGPGQGGRGAAGAAPPTPQASAPIDITGYWVSMIVDEWRFRVTPQKGDINYLPLNNEARQMANAWDPAKDEAEGKPCKAYGAVGVMQRPGRIHVTWDNPTTLKIEADAGTQTRVLHFGAAPADKGQPSWQGYSVAAWELPGGRGRRGAPSLGAADNLPDRPAGLGSLKVVTTNMLPGYIRKNGVPYSKRGADRVLQSADGSAERLVSRADRHGRRPDIPDGTIHQDVHVQEATRRDGLGTNALLE